jgi:hypothetical protein
MASIDEGMQIYREVGGTAENRESDRAAVDTNRIPRKFLLVLLQIISTVRTLSGGALRFEELTIGRARHEIDDSSVRSVPPESLIVVLGKNFGM